MTRFDATGAPSGRIDRMPPTDGEVLASPGDSSAASAANSSLSVPFSCGYCQRSFPRLSLLKKHEQVRPRVP